MQTQTSKTTTKTPYNLKKFVADVTALGACSLGLDLLKEKAKKFSSIKALLEDYAAAARAVQHPSFRERLYKSAQYGITPEYEALQIKNRQYHNLNWLRETVAYVTGVRAQRVLKVMTRAGIEPFVE